MRVGVRLLLALAAIVSTAARAEEYLGREQFLAAAFAPATPTAATLWITEALRAQAQQAIGLAPAALRVRYWQAGERTAWILEEIGKEQPITLGIVIEKGAVKDVEVLAFRESRGWEIRYPAFTAQYAGGALDAEGRVDQRVDGITGATLSVRAVDRAVRQALWLDGRVHAQTAASR